MLCVPLSSSLPHLILSFITLALIRWLDDTYVENTTGNNPLPLCLFSSTCSFKGSRYLHRSTSGHCCRSVFLMTERGGRGGGEEEEILSESSDDTMGFGV
jgi:hypothetical protein